MDLSKISTKELKKELGRRQEQANFNEWNTMPDNVPLYHLLEDQEKECYLVRLDDWCEGLTFLVVSKDFQENKNIINAVKHHILSNNETDIDSWAIRGMTVENIGRYGMETIEITSQ